MATALLPVLRRNKMHSSVQANHPPVSSNSSISMKSNKHVYSSLINPCAALRIYPLSLAPLRRHFVNQRPHDGLPVPRLYLNAHLSESTPAPARSLSLTVLRNRRPSSRCGRRLLNRQRRALAVIKTSLFLSLRRPAISFSARAQFSPQSSPSHSSSPS